LQLGNGGATGSILGNVVNNGVLSVNRSTNFTLSGAISGTGDLSKTGGGWLTLSNINSYSGETTINAGVIQGAANNALGTGVLTIGPGGNATTARLQLSGNATLPNAVALAMRNNTSVAVENVSGNNRLSGAITLNVGGSAAIFQSDAGVLTLGAITSAATGVRTPTLTGAGNGVVSGVISNGSGTVGVIKSGAGTWTLTNANTYTGDTVVNAGTLALGSGERIANSAALVLAGGTFSTGGFNETLGALTLSASSTINFASGAGTLAFGGLGTFTSGTTLTIANWTPGADHLFVGTTAGLTPAQLSQISFNGAAARQLSTGEIVPADQTPPALASAASRKTDTSGGPFDVPLDIGPGSGSIEPRAGGPTTLVFNFSEPVFAVDGAVGANEFVIGNASFASASASGSTLTLELTGVVDTSTVSVALQGLRDAAGNALGATSVSVGVLCGDVTRDRTVDFNDLVVLAQNYNTVGGMTLEQGDLNADGSVDFNDLVLIAQRYNTTLPAPAAVAAASADDAGSVLADASVTRTPEQPVFNMTTRIRPPAPVKSLKRV
jgi:autotransporter-associated beta strand protein